MKWRGEETQLSTGPRFHSSELSGLFEANGLRCTRAWQAGVLWPARARSAVKILADEALTRRLVELECRYGDDPLVRVGRTP